MSSIVLADFVPYLLNRAGMKIGVAFAREIASLDVTLPMWRVLVALWESGGQTLSQLSERTSMDISTLSRLVANLQRKRLLLRGRSGSDGRALHLDLTARGRLLTDKIIPIARRYEEVAIRGMSEADIRRLKSLLVRIYSNLETVDQEDSATAESRAAPDRQASGETGENRPAKAPTGKGRKSPSRTGGDLL
jgi:DNA-binding MarR family transcriptional regulator